MVVGRCRFELEIETKGKFLFFLPPSSAVTLLRTMSRLTQAGTGHPSEYTPGPQAPRPPRPSPENPHAHSGKSL